MKQLLTGLFIAICSVMSLIIICLLAGARVNTTKSVPAGLYWSSSEPAGKGAYVMFCPPQNDIFQTAMDRGYTGVGYCPGGYGYLIKQVSAAANDTISISDEGVLVNDRLLPLSTPLEADPSGRPLPRLRIDHYTLGDFEVLLMSNVSSTSFDGRYFGPINLSQIKTVVRPVLTW